MNNRQEWIDRARGVALLLVVIGHLGIPYIGQFFTTFHLPLFFFLSGITFSVKKSFAEFLRSKAKRLIIPYFCLGVPLILSSFVTRMVEGITDPASYWSVVVDFLLQQRMYTIWFLPCLFFASVLLYGIVKLTRGHYGWIMGICVALGIVGLCYWEIGGSAWIWNVDAAFVAVMFMGIGYCICQTKWIHNEGNVKSWLLFFCAAVVYVLCVAINGFIVKEKFDMAMCWGGCIPVSLVAIASGIYCTVFLTKRFRFKLFNYLGQNTMVYFAWHQSVVLPLLMALYHVMGWFQSNSLVSDAARTALTLVLIFLVLWPVDILFRSTKLRVAIGK